MANSLLASPRLFATSIAQLQNRFLSILPHIEAYAQTTFHYLQCPCQKEDAVAELIALAWKWFRYLGQKDQHANEFLVGFLAAMTRAVGQGKCLAGSQKEDDTKNSSIRNLNNLSSFAPQLSIPEQVAFRLDFQGWLNSLQNQEQLMIQDFIAGETTEAVAKKHGLSTIEVIRLRRDLFEDWQQFNNSEPF